jgi:hypothetical protein
MFSKLKILILTASMMLVLSGCGDLLGTKAVKRSLDGSQFSVSCELDMDKFSEIMHENISSQIRCLGENLNLFFRIVKSGKPGYLSREQLESYLAEFRPDVKPEVVKALGSIFQLGHLITGEDPNYVSKETVDKVINFALLFNQEAALNFGPIFENESPVTYALHQNHRERVSAANKAIIQSLRQIFNPNRNGETHKLNINELLDSFTTNSTSDEIEKAKKVLFAKGLLLGGKNDEITHNELEKLILNFDHLLLIALDAVRYEYIILNQESILQLLKRDVNDLYDIITQGALNNRDDQTLFTIAEAMDAAKVFITDKDFDIDQYKNLIVEAKKILMKGNDKVVKGIEIKNLFTHARSLLQSGTVFHRIYDKFKAQLDRPLEVDIDFSEYRHTYPEHQTELDNFERIVKRYRFMKGEFISAYYTPNFKRNPDAVFEIYALEYALKLVFSVYGSPSPNANSVGGYSIDQKQMQALMKNFENELIDLKLILPQRYVSTADNISLLGTLFQYQSDTNKVMDVNEATEFAETLFSSMNVADDLFDYMKKDQKCSVDRFDRIEPECVHRSYWIGLCRSYRAYYPLLFTSLNFPERCEDFQNTAESAEFLTRLTKAARSCTYYADGQREEVPFSNSDLMTTTVALLHAETTIIRWDVNKNNYLDADEVNRAYEIYSGALDGFLKDKSPVIRAFKKQIYQYMIKYEQVPDEKDYGSIWKFVRFLLKFDKKAPASRKTIASLLMAIGEQNALMNPKKFDCSLLRDPENIPREASGVVVKNPLPTDTISHQETMKLLQPVSAYIERYWTGDLDVLRQEVILLSQEMESGRINDVGEIKTKNVRTLFTRISKDKDLMKNIHQVFSEGSVVEKIALSISMIITNNN